MLSLLYGRDFLSFIINNLKFFVIPNFKGHNISYLDVPLSPLLPIYNVIQFKSCNFFFMRFSLYKSLSVTILLFSHYIYIRMYQLGIGGINKIK